MGLQYNKFNRVAKRNVHQRTHGVAHPLGHALSRVAQETREGDDGDGVQGEDDARLQVGGLDGNSDRNHHQEDIDIAGEDDGPRGDVEPHGDILPLGLLELYDSPLPISLRRWSGWRVVG